MLPAGSELVKIDMEKQARCGWRDMRLCWGHVFLVINLFLFSNFIFKFIIYTHMHAHMHTHICECVAYICVCVCVCVMCMPGGWGRQKKASDFLKLELMSHHTGAGTKCGFSARAAGAFNCWAISEVLLPPCIFFGGGEIGSHLARSGIQRWSAPYSWR